MQILENRHIPLQGSTYKDDHGQLVEVSTANYSQVTFWRGETLCTLPLTLFAKRMRLVFGGPSRAVVLDPVTRPNIATDHPLIDRFLALRGKQPTRGHRRRRAGEF